ncbi:Stk1 family PASTA domain-containing Ser/Thr kinase [Lactobacillus hominis]|uniref:non-specific serine/threonine protein kinase n=1 Tax=Lactobacillus hominis DSM 23910 = CRBIP 24.179 TaxID=1423758 RepID=I7KHA5_9LACO|nr:Stk1 family PASTA domain-containing Ser/Thr kinase [Lactobacillus hominis]KRM85548.1 serine threonine kinase protein [Lactobacillus hominis DSM 23910 = CRBIP 24.179]MCT3347391.1 Stk1 family PASTA domain-containing Ser/Thr kinase [Lactobacillus hominis]CCI81935.1 Possible non-specific serine/threonine protein kinase [Lactobacillus hominis DSM 23910 = CRBIP 24.179]
MFDKGYLLGGRYKIISLLGEGGMANVYLAEDIILKRKVAVKVLRLDLQKDPQTIQRFQREALSISELSHPHIVSIFDVGSDHNRHYLVMEYVDGPDLEEYIQKNKPLSLKTVINIMDQILDAMALAHKHNVIHRDLKPQNILLDKKGNVKIVDFGIAVALNQSTMTQTNTAMGSVHYMSPEQARGSLATKQSDIYSLGIILYEMLMGQVPFGGENAVAVALKHFQEKTPSLRDKNPDIPQALENVVFKATAKDPRDRYKSVLEMKRDLDSCLDPNRQNEPVFKPEHNLDQDATIVLPDMNGSVTNTQEVEQTKQPDKKKTLWDNIKTHKWWWIGAGIAFVGIMLILGFALGRKDDVNVPNVANLTESQAKDSILASGLKIGKVTRKNSSTVKKGYLIFSSPSAGSTVKNGDKINLIVSKGPKMVSVPDVSGMRYSSARNKLEKLGFSVERNDTYSTDIPKNDVITQDVDPGQKLDPNKTTITLTVSKGARNSKPRQIKLRDLTGYSIKGAQDYAHDNGLNLRITEQEDSAQKDTVIKQDPAPGSMVDRGSTLHLIVSKGNSNDDEKSNSNSSSEDNSVTKSFTIPYQANNSDGNRQGNHIQIYIADDKHSIGNVYRDQYITSNQTYTIPFELSNGNGHIKIVRDGNTILDEDINK